MVPVLYIFFVVDIHLVLVYQHLFVWVVVLLKVIADKCHQLVLDNHRWKVLVELDLVEVVLAEVVLVEVDLVEAVLAEVDLVEAVWAEVVLVEVVLVEAVLVVMGKVDIEVVVEDIFYMLYIVV